MKTTDFLTYKKEARRISMVTAYDYTMARIVDGTNVDAVLVGDSLAMVMHGHASTLPATPELMALHIAAVSRGAPSKLIIGDMPFLSFRKGIAPAMDCVEAFLRAGAHAVKLEGVKGHERVIAHIVDSDIPVMGHLGLTPQSVQKFGGYKLQGVERSAAKEIMRQARQLEELGCFAVVLECVPAPLAKDISRSLKIPTIGIGAGPDTDGQVLVLTDLLGMNRDADFKFVRRYLDGHRLVTDALNKYDSDIKKGLFPAAKESFRCKS
jgi:3-methyl-2-oxobutanoate hydroxymethyltransferase